MKLVSCENEWLKITKCVLQGSVLGRLLVTFLLSTPYVFENNYEYAYADALLLVFIIRTYIMWCSASVIMKMYQHRRSMKHKCRNVLQRCYFNIRFKKILSLECHIKSCHPKGELWPVLGEISVVFLCLSFQILTRKLRELLQTSTWPPCTFIAEWISRCCHGTKQRVMIMLAFDS